MNRTVSHSCHLPLCRACLSQLDIRGGMGEVASQWVLCSQKSSLLVYPCVCVRVCVCVHVCVWQAACVHFLNLKEGAAECPNSHFCVLSSGTSFLRTADALRCWRRGRRMKTDQETECQESSLNLLHLLWQICVLFLCFLGGGDVSLTVLFKDLSWNLVLSLLVLTSSIIDLKIACFLLILIVFS